MSLLTIENITKSFFHRTILDHVSLRIQEGDRLGLIGPNGAGKTTLFKIITGQESPESGQVIKPGNVIIGYLSQHIDDATGMDSSALRSRELEELERSIHRLEAQMGHFDDHGSIAYREITKEYTHLTAKYESLDGYAFERNMKETLQGLGLAADALTRPFSSLSGGEKMRVALARILLTHPDILLLDEPTNHLDVSAMEWMEDYLSRFKGAMILISHDRYFLDKVTNQTAELDGGILSVRPGNYTKYMEQKAIEQDFARKELSRIEKELEHQTQVKQTMLSHRNMSGYHCREKVVEKLADQLIEARSTLHHSQLKKMNFKLLPKAPAGDPKRVLIEADRVGKAFDGHVIFSEVSFHFCANDKVVLVGPNGCGKSTLLSLLLGKFDEFDGTVRLSSQFRYAHMGQHVQFDDEEKTVLEELLSTVGCAQGEARSILARFGFLDVDCFKKIAVLSGGERSRLYLACLLQEMPDVLFLDEPTNHLDIPSREILENALSDFGGAIFTISHDRYFIERCARKVWGFMDGSMQEFESYDRYRLAGRKSRPVPCLSPESPAGSGEHPLDDAGSPDDISQSPAKVRQNKAEERRKTAQRREQIRFLEQQISGFETEKTALEASFEANTSPDEYRRYASLLGMIEKAYESYMELQEDE